MRSLFSLAAALAAPLLLSLPLAPCSHAIRIVQSNDDGWAELHLRTLNDVLRAANHTVLLSAPADNKSGSGSTDDEPDARTEPCHYDSCPADAGLSGANATRPDLRWVNSYPVTSMRYAIDSYARELWGPGETQPELALSGPNAGANVWFVVKGSGTVGAAVHAVHSGIPAIAFSVDSFATAPWNVDPKSSPMPARSQVYAQLALKLTEKLIASGKPYLPDGVFLNVNIQKAAKGDSAHCCECRFTADIWLTLERVRIRKMCTPVFVVAAFCKYFHVVFLYQLVTW
ncbi:survival protein surE domain-containing protein [Hirsutella rhossiliensis]|uniref:Survival protein surE domain-containing protein n=1 Tax=Hirsutella rhossiliensis TaxID=111463 RepID=A0A9P8N5G3_9HYPO|nr:survival protein surE domain-containing protein [Hirsutella rhossiliensis]KAH0967978.1 survival protein surE domain-containing protein [Hirsutella rhossiliensis]